MGLLQAVNSKSKFKTLTCLIGNLVILEIQGRFNNYFFSTILKKRRQYVKIPLREVLKNGVNILMNTLLVRIPSGICL